jgi:hypothetical protein
VRNLIFLIDLGSVFSLNMNKAIESCRGAGEIAAGAAGYMDHASSNGIISTIWAA